MTWGSSSKSEFSFAADGLNSKLVEVLEFSGAAGVSQLYRYTITLVVLQQHLAEVESKFDTLLGRSGTLTIRGDQSSYIHGIISSIQRDGGFVGKDLHRFSVEIVPRLWLLQNIKKSRIFQNKSAVDVVADVLKEHSIDHRSHVQSCPVREYCVQYQETDYEFVSRLFSEEGVFSFFEQTEDKHTFVYGNESGSFSNISGNPRVKARHPNQFVMSEEYVLHIVQTQSVRPGSVEMRTYYYPKPESPQTASTETSPPETAANASWMQYYEYPGRYTEPEREGRARTKARLEALRTDAVEVRGSSSCRRLAAGHTFEVIEHHQASFNQKYLITQVEMHGYQVQFAGAASNTLGKHAEQVEEHDEFKANFVAVPHETPIKPPRIVRPRVETAETAIVSGPEGEEIYTDKDGRIKVVFFWDREKKNADDNSSSCWIRVAQPWGGSHWGFQFIPRVGMEVVITFLNGDPDMPLVTGSVYNGKNEYPYALPEKKTTSGLKTNSTPKATGNNEIFFDDTATKEELHMHAQLNMTVLVENDYGSKVGHDQIEDVENDRTITVKRDEKKTITRNQTIEIDGDQTETIKGEQKLTVTKDQTHTISASRTDTVEQNEKTEVKGDRTDQVGGSETNTITGSRTTSITKDDTFSSANKTDTVAEKYGVTVNGMFMLKQAGATITITEGNVVIETSGTISITSEGPMTFQAEGPISMNSSETIMLNSNGCMVSIGGGKVAVTGPEVSVTGAAMTSIGGAMVKISGDAMTDLTGAFVLINS